MALFDKMFGRGASASMSQPSAQDRFNQLKQKYASVLQKIEREDVRLRNLHVENGKLVVKGDASSNEAKNRVWDEIKRVDPGYSDLVADIRVPQAAGGTYGTSTGARATGAGTGDAEGAGRAGGYAQSRTSDLDMPTPTSVTREQTYTVKAGDTLSKISQQFYGDADEYMRIFYANRDTLRDPDRIQVGQKLVIPPDID
jgi:nucleoid-associated protein YgaU